MSPHSLRNWSQSSEVVQVYAQQKTRRACLIKDSNAFRGMICRDAGGEVCKRTRFGSQEHVTFAG